MQFMTTQFNITQQKSKYVSWQFLLFLSFLRENSFINIFFNFHIYPLPPPPSFSLHLKWTHQWKIPGRSNYNTFIYFKKQNVLLINQLYLNEAYDWTTRQQWQMPIYSVIDNMLNKFPSRKQSYLEPSGSGSYLECGSQIRNSSYVSWYNSNRWQRWFPPKRGYRWPRLPLALHWKQNKHSITNHLKLLHVLVC